MTDWRTVAAAQELPIRPEDLDRIAPRLEELEQIFRPLQQQIPHNTLPWTGTE
jgi:hypothetical protein